MGDGGFHLVCSDARSVTVGTAGDGREAQRQEVGSNFRNTTRNTIDILSAIDFAKRLQASNSAAADVYSNSRGAVANRDKNGKQDQSNLAMLNANCFQGCIAWSLPS